MEINKKPEKDQSSGQENSHNNMIFVNGREFNWRDKEISFVQVIELAFGSYDTSPSAAYTMAFKRGRGNKPEGVLTYGESVKVKDKMIFNVTRTDKS